MVTTCQYDSTGHFRPKILDSQDTHEEWSVLKAARSTSAAPTYFQPLVITHNLCNYDGGIFANNPAIWGLIAATQSANLNEISLISVGTGLYDLTGKIETWIRILLTKFKAAFG